MTIAPRLLASPCFANLKRWLPTVDGRRSLPWFRGTVPILCKAMSWHSASAHARLPLLYGCRARAVRILSPKPRRIRVFQTAWRRPRLGRQACRRSTSPRCAPPDLRRRPSRDTACNCTSAQSSPTALDITLRRWTTGLSRSALLRCQGHQCSGPGCARALDARAQRINRERRLTRRLMCGEPALGQSTATPPQAQPDGRSAVLSSAVNSSRSPCGSASACG